MDRRPLALLPTLRGSHRVWLCSNWDGKIREVLDGGECVFPIPEASPRRLLPLSLPQDVEGVRGLVYSYDQRTGLPSIEF